MSTYFRDRTLVRILVVVVIAIYSSGGVLPDDLDLDFADSTGVGGEGH